MKRSCCLSLLLIPAVVLSCRQSETAGRETIPFVRQVAADSAGTFSIVKSYRESGPRGSIAVIGEPESTLLLTERFLTADVFDNIDGRRKPDGLPDFSGEVFDMLMDRMYEPYEHFVGSDLDSLREMTVRYALAAVDTVCLSSPFNPDLKLSKHSSKILVLTSSLCSEYGHFDVDTLFQMAGKRISLIDPVRAMFTAASDGRVGVQHFGVWASREVIDAGAYQAVFRRRYHDGSTLSAFCPAAEGDLSARFRDFLRQYREGASGPLTALLLDDYGVDPSFIAREIDRIRTQATEEDVALSRIISPEFRCIEPMGAITSACYRILRRDNRFTHDIAYPRARFYQTEESENGDPVMIELSDRYLASEIDSFMDVNTLTTKAFYVQDQY